MRCGRRGCMRHTLVVEESEPLGGGGGAGRLKRLRPHRPHRRRLHSGLHPLRDRCCGLGGDLVRVRVRVWCVGVSLSVGVSGGGEGE